MTKKVYKTALGKQVDMGALMLQHENVKAVGNMGVNARGDIVDSSNKVVERANQRISKQYAKQVSKMSADPVTTSAPRKPKVVPETVVDAVEEPVLEETNPTSTNEGELQSGLAAAIAKARSANKDKTARQQSGVKKPQ